MKYYLMHKDVYVALFEVDNEKVTNVEFCTDENSKSHLPFGINTKQQLKNWVMHRCIPNTRRNLKSALLNVGVSSAFKYMLQNRGLSLTDCYWFMSWDERGAVHWKDVEMYNNKFEINCSFELDDELNPSSTLRGNLEKKWAYVWDGVNLFIKGNRSDNSCMESLCEVFASNMHKLQGYKNYVTYELMDLVIREGAKSTVCICFNFTGVNRELVHAIDIIENKHRPNDISYYEFYISECEKNGLDVREFLEYQIMTDFIMSNTDRHLNNFGILRNPDTLEWVGFAPIFDSGNAMFCDLDYVPVSYDGLLNLTTSSFLNREVNMLKYVKNHDLVDASKLPDDIYLYNLLLRDNMPEEDILNTVRAYKHKVKMFIDFQNGANIWSYNYKG